MSILNPPSFPFPGLPARHGDGTVLSLWVPEIDVDGLMTLSASAASAQLASWIPKYPETLALLPVALSDETWAAARARIDHCEDLKSAWLPYGVGSLGLEVMPRLIEAHADTRISKHARFVYRLSIVSALAVAGSRGEPLPDAYDDYLRFDPAAWWFAKRPYLYKQFHQHVALEIYVGPLLQAAIATLPGPRAHRILDEALDTARPKQFPLAFLALPCLRAHWRPEYVERAGRAIAWHEAGNKASDGNERSKAAFVADARAMGVYEQVLIEVFRHGGWDDNRWLHVADVPRFLAAARDTLPDGSYQRLAARYGL